VNHTVVLVDDVPEIRKILRLILEHAGPFEIVGEGRDGNEATALAAELRPDLLVMDVEMRGGPSGWEALPRIRECSPQTAVVILSGSATDPLQGHREVMADAVLEKGMAPQELNDALLEIVQRAHPNRSVAPEPAAAPAPSPGERAPSGVVPGDADVADGDVLAALQAEVQRLADELAGFASVASHDLAQPLQVAYGYLEMVRSEFGEGMDPTALSWIDHAITSLERMRQLVQDILAFARSGNREIEPEPVSLEEAVALASAHVAAAVQERAATLHLAPHLPTVVGNEDHVVTVLVHLLSNAMRFVPADTPAVVHVLVHDGGGEWVVDVSDNGPGIDPADREKVFDLFSRGPRSANAGTGLGLAICRKLVHRMHGRIWAQDREDGKPGASVRFALAKDATGSAPIP
jgi:signal transduction histidine kinase